MTNDRTVGSPVDSIRRAADSPPGTGSTANPPPTACNPAGHHPQNGPQQVWGAQQGWGQPQPGPSGEPNAYPSYARPGGYHPQQRKRSKLPWILGGVAVLLFVTLGGNGPEDVVARYETLAQRQLTNPLAPPAHLGVRRPALPGTATSREGESSRPTGADLTAR
ncbi:hypothetical protein [Actinopolyspora xinjiangensis]|uniref:hypothetical protein n=1 Tax=Actinopolyspora xinjiangensis TaxID=405564 RepID=UPI001114071B|nr:hypothetical protein [Actinopolyspora xinjiangensis]